MKNTQEGAMSKQGKPAVHTQMLTFRCSPEERIELGKLAHRRRQSVSDVLRGLIAQAATAQRTSKSAASVATPTNELAA